MELNREQIIKDLQEVVDNYSGSWKRYDVLANALALIKEFAEENECLKQQNEIYEVLNKKLEDACESYAWQYGTAVSKELFLKKERENTVREMQKRLTDRDEFSLRADYDGIYYIDHACWVNQVAAEILGEE